MSTTKRKSRANYPSLRDLAEQYIDGREVPSRFEQDRRLALAGGHFLWTLKRRRGEVYLFDSPKALCHTCQKLKKSGQRALPSERASRALIKRVDEVVKSQWVGKRKMSSPKDFGDDGALANRLDLIGSLQRYFFRQIKVTTDLKNLASRYKPSDLLPILHARLRGFKRGEFHWESPLEGLLTLSMHSPFFLFYEDDLFISRPPVELHCDFSGRVNATDRPAIRFRDDWSICVIGGVHVNEGFFSPKYTIKTNEILAEENLEVRRVMMERIGIDRFLEGIEAKELARDDYGVLYQGREYALGRFWTHLKEPLTYVRLLNSTPEPGTTDEFKEYLLRVPPTVKTPQEAVAWSFELETEKYEPIQQT